ncbi:unnamed protein product, partial [Didymodactylos carnosus]
TSRLNVRRNDPDGLDLEAEDNGYSRRKPLLKSPSPSRSEETDTYRPTSNRQEYLSDVSLSYGSLRNSHDLCSRSFEQRLPDTAGVYLNEHKQILQHQHLKDLTSLTHRQPQFLLSNESHLIAQQLDHFITEQPTPGSHVFNIQGLTSKWNCEKLFNFLCLYGNVLRVSVKFLKSKDGSAMVQMNNCDNLRQYLRNLNSTYIFGKKIVIVGSRQPQIEPVQRPYELADKEPSYMDFTTNRNNRYLTSEQAQKNRPVAPSNVLYYFNTPPLMTEIDIVRFFDDLGGKRPLKIKNFPARKQEHNGERNRRGQNQPRGVTGLAEFRNITDACECLVLANNYPLQHSASNWPFYFKLTFSGTPITDSDALFGEDLDVSLATITIGAVPEKRTLSPSADDENRSHRRHHSNSSSSAHRHHERRAHSGEQRSPSQE